MSAGRLADVAFGDEEKRTRISELENGKVSKPQARTIRAISDALGITEAELDNLSSDAGDTKHSTEPSGRLPRTLMRDEVTFSIYEQHRQKEDGRSVVIMNQWKTNGMGVLNDAINELGNTPEGRMLLVHCFNLLEKIEELPITIGDTSETPSFPIYYHIFDLSILNDEWCLFISVLQDKACILMFRPMISQHTWRLMAEKCILRASTWSSHCNRDCGRPRAPVPLTEAMFGQSESPSGFEEVI